MLESGTSRAAPIDESADSFSTEPERPLRRIGDYELLEEIGRGGMGVVFKARQIRLNRLVAVKLILAGPLASGSFVRRFHIEAEATAKLDHANIVSIYEIAEENGQHYYAMKLVEGANLAILLRRGLSSSPKTLSENPATVVRTDGSPAGAGENDGGPADRPRWGATLIGKLARAVHYAHERGVLHRDLKPANILIDHHDEPFVTDFGLARILEHDSSLTGSEAAMGTPAYMAPEQASGKAREATTASDIYSLGAVLYELLTGRQPFSGETPLEIMRQTTEVEPDRPRALNPKVDRDLETICLKCLEKQPSARYASAQALANDLERWLCHESISARPTSTWTQVRKWVRRKPLVAGLAGSVAVLFVLGFAGVTWQWRRAERRGVDLALNVYGAEMQLALQSWEDGNTANALRLLENHRTAPWRGFEWRYLLQQSHSGRATLPINGTSASEVAFSPDGKWLVAAEHNRQQRKHSIGVWDTASMQRVTTLPLPSKPGDVWWIGGFTFLDGGRTLAADCNDGRVRRWDLDTGKEELLLPEKTQGAWPPRMSPDGKWLVGAFRKTQDRSFDFRVFDAASGAQVGSRTSVPLAGRFMNDHKIRCSPDSRLLAVASRPDMVRIFSLPTLEETATLSVLRQPQTIAFSHASDLLAVSGLDRSIQVWNIQAARLLMTLEGPKASSFDLCFSPDGTLLASASQLSVITLWDLASGTARAEFQGHTRRPNALAFSPDGKLLASGAEDGTVRLWETNLRSGSPLQRPRTNEFWRVAFSPDSRLLAARTIDGAVQLFDAVSEEWVATLRSANHSTDESLSWEVRDLPLHFSPDGKLLAAGNGNHTASVWNVAERREMYRLTNHAAFVQAVAFAPDSKTLLTASEDKTLRLWDVASARLVSSVGAAHPLRFGNTFSPDGSLVVYSGAVGELSLWDVKERKVARSWRAHPTEVFAMAFSPDGRKLASSCEQMVKLWDIPSGAELARLDGVRGAVFSLLFTPDAQTLIVPEITGHIRMWHLPSLREAGVLKAPQDLISAALSPDGNVLATCSLEGVRLFRAAGLEAGVPTQSR